MIKATIFDRNEAAYLLAVGLTGEPVPRMPRTLDFMFEANEQLFEARQAYSVNTPVPVLSFIEASRQIGAMIVNYRNRGELI